MEKLYPTGPVTRLLEQMSNLQRFREEKRDRFETLTNREVEVLSLIAKGMKNTEIANELEISRITVQNHRSRIRGKLDVKYFTDYVKYALAYDLVQL